MIEPRIEEGRWINSGGLSLYKVVFVTSNLVVYPYFQKLASKDSRLPIQTS